MLACSHDFMIPCWFYALVLCVGLLSWFYVLVLCACAFYSVGCQCLLYVVFSCWLRAMVFRVGSACWFYVLAFMASFFGFLIALLLIRLIIHPLFLFFTSFTCFITRPPASATF